MKKKYNLGILKFDFNVHNLQMDLDFLLAKDNKIPLRMKLKDIENLINKQYKEIEHYQLLLNNRDDRIFKQEEEIFELKKEIQELNRKLKMWYELEKQAKEMVNKSINNLGKYGHYIGYKPNLKSDL